jgi:hypothetical protein
VIFYFSRRIITSGALFLSTYDVQRSDLSKEEKEAASMKSTWPRLESLTAALTPVIVEARVALG